MIPISPTIIRLCRAKCYYCKKELDFSLKRKNKKSYFLLRYLQKRTTKKWNEIQKIEKERNGPIRSRFQILDL